jgi:hypothetical protein
MRCNVSPARCENQDRSHRPGAAGAAAKAGGTLPGLPTNEELEGSYEQNHVLKETVHLRQVAELLEGVIKPLRVDKLAGLGHLHKGQGGEPLP